MRASIAVRLIAVLAIGAAPTARVRTMHGRVMDAEGRPVAGAAVSALAPRLPARRLLELSRGEQPEPIAATKTDASGAFILRLDADTDASLRVDASGFPSLEVASPDQAEPSEVVELVLAAASRLEGRVTDEGGRAVAGARVGGAHGDGDEEGASVAEAVSGAEGRFALANAPAGVAAVFVHADGYVSWM